MSFIQPCLKWVVNTWQRRLLAGILFVTPNVVYFWYPHLIKKEKGPILHQWGLFFVYQGIDGPHGPIQTAAASPLHTPSKNRPNFLPAQVLYQWVVHNDWFTQQGSQEDMFWLVKLSAQGLQPTEAGVWRCEGLKPLVRWGRGTKHNNTMGSAILNMQSETYIVL